MTLTATHNRRAVRMVCLVTTDQGRMYEIEFDLDNKLSGFTADSAPNGWTVEILSVEWE